MACTCVFYCIYSEVTPYTTDSTDLHITCTTCVADLHSKCHVCVKCDSRYFYIVVMLYSVGANLYGHLVIMCSFADKIMNSVLSSLILSALLLIQFDTSIMQSWIRVIASCTAVVMFAHYIYIFGCHQNNRGS